MKDKTMNTELVQIVIAGEISKVLSIMILDPDYTNATEEERLNRMTKELLSLSSDIMRICAKYPDLLDPK